MAQGKININISIAGKSYPMTLEAANEELYRVAAKRLNEKITELSKIPKLEMQDRIAIAAFGFAMLAVSNERTSALGDEDIEALHAIEERIRNYVKG